MQLTQIMMIMDVISEASTKIVQTNLGRFIITSKQK
jgi:hypothetical protein